MPWRLLQCTHDPDQRRVLCERPINPSLVVVPQKQPDNNYSHACSPFTPSHLFSVAILCLQEDITVSDVDDIIAALKRGETPKPGPYNGRKAAEPLGGPTTLLSEPRGPGKFLRTDGEL